MTAAAPPLTAHLRRLSVWGLVCSIVALLGWAVMILGPVLVVLWDERYGPAPTGSSFDGIEAAAMAAVLVVIGLVTGLAGQVTAWVIDVIVFVALLRGPHRPRGVWTAALASAIVATGIPSAVLGLLATMALSYGLPASGVARVGSWTVSALIALTPVVAHAVLVGCSSRLLRTLAEPGPPTAR